MSSFYFLKCTFLSVYFFLQIIIGTPVLRSKNASVSIKSVHKRIYHNFTSLVLMLLFRERTRENDDSKNL